MNNLKSIKEYFQKQNVRGGKPSSDVQNWNNQVGEILNVLNSTNPNIEKEFNKLIQSKIEIKDKISSLDNLLSGLKASPNILMHRTESDEKFFKEHDKTQLLKVAEVFSKISELRTKNDSLAVLFTKLNAEYELLNRVLPSNLGEDLVKNMKNLLIGDLYSIQEILNEVFTHQGRSEIFEKIDEAIKFSGGIILTHANELNGLLTEARTRLANFLKELEKLTSVLEGYKTNLEATDKFVKETRALSENLYKISQEIEAKEKNQADAKKAQVKSKENNENTPERKTEEQNDLYNLTELKQTLNTAQGIVGVAKGILSKKNRDEYDDVIKRFSSFAIGLKNLMDSLNIKQSDASISQTVKSFKSDIDVIYQLFANIINGIKKIQKVAEVEKQEFEEITLEYIKDLNNILSKQIQKKIDDLIKILTQLTKKKKK